MTLNVTACFWGNSILSMYKKIEKYMFLYDFFSARVVYKLYSTCPKHLFQKACLQKHAREKKENKHV